MSATLELSGLTRTYPGSLEAALAGLDLVVPAGRCVALLGPSGSGKTTAMRIVAGLDAPDAGDVRIDGASVLGHPPERRGMAMVFQRPLLFPHLSVLDNVAFSARMAGASRREARASAARYLDLVQLGAYADRRTATLSGGQAQRVALARGLAAEPSVLLLDEPFSALDPLLREDMHRLVLELRAVLEPTILLVTHDQQEAVTLADTIAIMTEGRVLQHGDVQQLYGAPESLAVHRFLGGLNEFPGVVEGDCHVSSLGRLELDRRTPRADGPAVLVARHEAVDLVDPEDDAADAVGRVSRVVALGATCLVEVAAAGGVIHAELPTVLGPRAGQRVGVRIPLAARVLVPVEPRRARGEQVSMDAADRSVSR
jgi:putative spermidine/putrescine transport system ATP-binding protein